MKLTFQHLYKMHPERVLVANEAIYNFTEKGGKVYACILDIDKCFDKLWWNGLLYKMYQIRCMVFGVFGESKRRHRINQVHRAFHLGDNAVEEVSHYDHIGIKLCAYDSPMERTKEACQKGNRSLSTLNGMWCKNQWALPICVVFPLEYHMYTSHATWMWSVVRTMSVWYR